MTLEEAKKMHSRCLHLQTSKIPSLLRGSSHIAFEQELAAKIKELNRFIKEKSWQFQ